MKKLLFLLLLSGPALADNHVYQIQTDTITVTAIKFKDGSVQVSSPAAVSGAAHVVAQADLLNQVGDISFTLLYTPAVSGFYRVGTYATCVSTAAGTTAPTIYADYTDETGTFSQAPIGTALSLTNVGNNTAGGAPTNADLFCEGGQPIQFDVEGGTYNGATYDVHIRVEGL